MRNIVANGHAVKAGALPQYMLDIALLLAIMGVLTLLAITGVFERYVVFLLTLIMIYATTTTGLTLFMGYAGQLSIGHAAFFGLGAYVAANLTKAGFPFVLAVIIGGLSSLVAGYLIGFLALRLRGFYLAVMTLAVGLISVQVYRNWDAFTGGVTGLGRIPAPSVFGYALDGPVAYLLVCMLVFIIAYALAVALVRAPVGKAMRAISANELAAQSIGINTYQIKVHIFALSTGLAGISGGLYAHLTRYITPEHFNFSLSIEFLTMVIVGGLGHVIGGIVGTVIIVLCSEELRNFPQLQPIFYGTLLLLTAYLPAGATGLLIKLWNLIISLFRRKSEACRSNSLA